MTPLKKNKGLFLLVSLNIKLSCIHNNYNKTRVLCLYDKEDTKAGPRFQSSICYTVAALTIQTPKSSPK